MESDNVLRITVNKLYAALLAAQNLIRPLCAACSTFRPMCFYLGCLVPTTSVEREIN